MATAVTGKARCVMCEKDKATIRCGGCLEEFCFNHWESHRQELNKKLDEIEMNRDLFRQSLTQQLQQPTNHILMQQIDRWEQNSIKIIKQTAEETREVLLRNTNENIRRSEIKLNELTHQLQQSRVENDFNEINLRQFQDELNQLTEQLTKPGDIAIRKGSTPIINRISVHVSGSTFPSDIHYHEIYVQNGITVAGGNGFGKELNQLNHPISMCVDDDQSIYVADAWNNRIVKWKYNATNGQLVTGRNEEENKTNQLDNPTDVIIDKERNNLIICDLNNRRVVRWSRRNGTSSQLMISNIDCRGLIMDNNGYLYISDKEKDEVRRWKVGDTSGILVAGGNGRGNRLDQLNHPTFIFVGTDHSVYVSDSSNHRVMKWMEGAKEGIVVAGGQGQGNGLTQLSGPAGLTVDHLGTVYVADRNNHRIMRWYKGATQGNIVVGGNGKGKQANQLNGPLGLSFDLQGNLYVVDWNNHRIQRFNINHS